MYRPSFDISNAVTAPTSMAGVRFPNAAANNQATGYVSTLTQVFINGGNENARVATNPTTVSPFFLGVSNIGAVFGANDTWYVGWTCGLAGAAAC